MKNTAQFKWMMLIDPGKILLLLQVISSIPLKIIERVLIKDAEMFHHYHYKRQFFQNHSYNSVFIDVQYIIIQNFTNYFTPSHEFFVLCSSVRIFIFREEIV